MYFFASFQSIYRAGCRVFLLPFFLTLLSVFNPVYAKWYEVSSDHFVIYANDKPAKIEKFARRLELFHDALNFWYGQSDSVPSPSNRLTVYVVGSKIKVKELAKSSNKHIAGFYRPLAGHPLTVIPPIAASNSNYILYHEYAHHYQYYLDSFPYPRWLKEGFAEFFASVKFEEESDVIRLGMPAYHRISELRHSEEIPVRLLIDTLAYEEKRQEMYNWKHDSFYGQSWTLFHMLQFSKDRAGQFAVYLTELRKGNTEIGAAESAFGDLDQLQKDLDQYQKQKRMSSLPLKISTLDPGDIKTTELGKWAKNLMPLRIEIKNGITPERGAELVEELQLFAEKYPDDYLVLETLAEAAVDAGQSRSALEWSERAIEIRGSSVFANILKGYALEQIAVAGEDSDISWKEVRNQFARANKLEPENPIPLREFYETFIEAGLAPTDNSVNGLRSALAFAPYDHDLRWQLASQLVDDGEYSEGINVMSPLAKHPHRPELSEAARKFIEAAQTMASQSAE